MSAPVRGDMTSDEWKLFYGPVQAAFIGISLATVPVPVGDFLAHVRGMSQRQRDIFVATLVRKGVLALNEETGTLSCVNLARAHFVGRMLLDRRLKPAARVIYGCPLCGGDGCEHCAMRGEFSWDDVDSKVHDAFLVKNGLDGEGWEPLPGVCLDALAFWDQVDHSVSGPMVEDVGPSGFDHRQALSAIAPVTTEDGVCLTNSLRLAYLLAEVGVDPVDVHIVMSDPDDATNVHLSTPFPVYVSSLDDIARDMRRKFSKMVLEFDGVSDEIVSSITESVAHGMKDDGILCVLCALGSSGPISDRVARHLRTMDEIYGPGGRPEDKQNMRVLYARDISVIVATMPWLNEPTVKNVSLLKTIPTAGFLLPAVEGGEPLFYGLQAGSVMTEYLRALTRSTFQLRCYQAAEFAFVTADGSSSTGFAVVSRTFRSRGSHYSRECTRRRMGSSFVFYMLEVDHDPRRLTAIRAVEEVEE